IVPQTARIGPEDSGQEIGARDHIQANNRLAPEKPPPSDGFAIVDSLICRQADPAGPVLSVASSA
ncbi:MAG TPA: hypothetical protein PL109_13280, partial [Nitrospira sp.]|nr:hypothetical protein [Nitrospira sp.]